MPQRFAPACRKLSHRVVKSSVALALVVFCSSAPGVGAPAPVAHWPLHRDAGDVSPHEQHGIAHKVDLAGSGFNGRDSYIRIGNTKRLNAISNVFTLSLWVDATSPISHAPGDLISKLDSERKTGYVLSLAASKAGYNGVAD